MVAVRPRLLPVAMGLAALATVGWACLEPDPGPAAPAAAATALKWSEAARDALVPTCGTCHRSDLPTAKPGALAIFDLTKDMWWMTLTEDHDAGLLRRVKGSSDITDEDKHAVEAFLEELRHATPVEERRRAAS